MAIFEAKISFMGDGPHTVKCPRCWKWHGVEANYDHLCDRCQDVLLDEYPDHESIPGIKAALEEQRKRWLKSPSP